MAKKILIIEDEEYLLEMYKMRLEASGYIVFGAENGEEGLEVAGKVKPDLVLLDILLPKMDGYDVLRKLRGKPETKSLGVIILSNLGQNTEVKKGMDIGANGYWIKSNLTPTQLTANIDNYFSGQNIEEAVPKKKAAIKAKAIKKNEKNSEKARDLRILMIEDNEGLLEMYSMQFANSDIQVDAAKNGAWGIKMAEQKKYDAIIMDMVMPAMNGYSALEKLKSSDATKNIPVLLLSNSALDEEIEKAKSLGAADYLLKSSTTPAQLINRIKKLINNSKAVR